ncbi:unnamed protein product, partial [Rotaria socialis]
TGTTYGSGYQHFLAATINVIFKKWSAKLSAEHACAAGEIFFSAPPSQCKYAWPLKYKINKQNILDNYNQRKVYSSST